MSPAELGDWFHLKLCELSDVGRTVQIRRWRVVSMNEDDLSVVGEGKNYIEETRVVSDSGRHVYRGRGSAPIDYFPSSRFTPIL